MNKTITTILFLFSICLSSLAYGQNLDNKEDTTVYAVQIGSAIQYKFRKIKRPYRPHKSLPSDIYYYPDHFVKKNIPFAESVKKMFCATDIETMKVECFDTFGFSFGYLINDSLEFKCLTSAVLEDVNFQVNGEKLVIKRIDIEVFVGYSIIRSRDKNEIDIFSADRRLISSPKLIHHLKEYGGSVGMIISSNLGEFRTQIGVVPAYD